jgi:hypothetical protein
MLKVIIKVTDWAEYEDGELVKELDEAKIKITEAIIDEKKLDDYLENDEITAFTKATKVCEVRGLTEWIENDDDDVDIEYIHSKLESDEIYVTTRCGGGEVLKLAHGTYSYNHNYQDFEIDEPCDEAETLITWEQYKR